MPLESSGDKQACAKCRVLVDVKELNADDLCEICAALDSLWGKLVETGRAHPNLFEKNYNAPTNDP